MVVAGFHRAVDFCQHLKEAVDLGGSSALRPLLDQVPESWLALGHVGFELQPGSVLFELSLLLSLCFLEPGLSQGFDSGFLLFLFLNLLVGNALLFGEKAFPEGSCAGVHCGSLV